MMCVYIRSGNLKEAGQIGTAGKGQDVGIELVEHILAGKVTANSDAKGCFGE